MMASTARIIAGTAPSGSRDGPRSLTAPGGRGLGLDGPVRELQVGPAAHAHGVVQLDDVPARRALPAQLVALGAIQHRPDQPEHGQRGADEEPQEERRPLDPADDPGGDAEPEREDQIDHRFRRAQITPNTTATTSTSANSVWMRPATMAISTLNAKTATTAMTRKASALRRSAEFMPGSVSRRAEGPLIVEALEVREALGARDLAVLEAQAGQTEAAHGRVRAPVGGDQREPADRRPGRCGSSGGRHALHGGAGPAVAAWPGSRMFTWPTYPLCRAAASSAGRIRASRRRRTRQRAPEKAWLATVAKPVSSSRSASSRWAIRSAEGRPGSRGEARGEPPGGETGWTHQQCTRCPPGRTSSAPASPTSHVPSAPRSMTSPVRACSSRASWPTRSPSRPSAVRSGPSAARRRGLTTFAPRLA